MCPNPPSCGKDVCVRMYVSCTPRRIGANLKLFLWDALRCRSPEGVASTNGQYSVQPQPGRDRKKNYVVDVWLETRVVRYFAISIYVGGANNCACIVNQKDRSIRVTIRHLFSGCPTTIHAWLTIKAQRDQRWTENSSRAWRPVCREGRPVPTGQERGDPDGRRSTHSAGCCVPFSRAGTGEGVPPSREITLTTVHPLRLTSEIPDDDHERALRGRLDRLLLC